MNQSGNGQSILQLLILNRVSSDKSRACFQNLRMSTAQNFSKDVARNTFLRKTTNVQRIDRISTHRVHVAQGVRSGNLAKQEWIIASGGDKIDGLHKSDAVG